MSPLIWARYRFAHATISNKFIYVIGGINYDHPVTSVEMFDLNS